MPASPIPRLARYLAGGEVRTGRVEGDLLVRVEGPAWAAGRETGDRDPLAAVRLLAPVAPGKIVCVGLNYLEHVAESASVVPGTPPPSEPLLFLKPPSAVIGTGEPIRLPPRAGRVDPEGEMAVVIGRRAHGVPRGRAMDHVAGVTAFNDVSARDYQRRDGQWTRAKGFDTFAPLGPWLALGLDPRGLGLELRVNGERRQRGDTSDLLFDVPTLVSAVSHIMTLEPGDVIATGTPAGVAPIAAGDVVEIELEGVGVLSNPVEAATG